MTTVLDRPAPIPTADATRRRFLTGGLSAAALLVAGCGAGDDGGPAPADAGYPRTVAHARGATTLDRRPQRVVTKYQGAELDALLAVGVQPVASMNGNPEPFPWNRDAASRQAVLSPVAGFASADWDLEALAAQRPDLIVCQDGEFDKAADALPRVAPCIVIDANVAPDWRVDARLIASAFGLERAADDAVAATDAVLARARAALAPLGGPSVRLFDATDLAYLALRGAGSQPGKLVGELGVRVADETDYAQVSAERLTDLGGTDLLLVTGWDDAGIDSTLASPLFGRVPQVQAGRWARLEIVTNFANDSVLSVRYGAPRLAEALLSAARGEGGRRF